MDGNEIIGFHLESSTCKVPLPISGTYTVPELVLAARELGVALSTGHANCGDASRISTLLDLPEDIAELDQLVTDARAEHNRTRTGAVPELGEMPKAVLARLAGMRGGSLILTEDDLAHDRATLHYFADRRKARAAFDALVDEYVAHLDSEECEVGRDHRGHSGHRRTEFVRDRDNHALWTLRILDPRDDTLATVTHRTSLAPSLAGMDRAAMAQKEAVADKIVAALDEYDHNHKENRHG